MENLDKLFNEMMVRDMACTTARIRLEESCRELYEGCADVLKTHPFDKNGKWAFKTHVATPYDVVIGVRVEDGNISLITESGNTIEASAFGVLDLLDVTRKAMNEITKED